ncbi:ADP-heptose--LPS heptosyltransferase RfaF [Pantoea sp. Aalb]|uniref:ADP-heptose--LPS heptosyltransferase RfaF n=1 Tax=Pantoea sp. Aalb TaxID=2576762 RepID=UPI001327B74D|nr:ADP-heptose--LPS heptosyltransferase RfaF [Pantoea sp. Aalb]MXP67936.1 ADP-heptose--LPS heptosyltransferase RfaF [Pantoea sp. Aalb]
MLKILVIGPSWIGDMVMSQSLYRTIKTKYNESIIDVIAPAWCHPLLSRMPEVDSALNMPLDHGILALKKRYYLGKSLETNNYDRAYVLPNSFKSALIPFFAGIKHRIGWRGEMRYLVLNDIRILNKVEFPMMVERYIALGYDESSTFSHQLPHPILWPKLVVNEDEKQIIIKKFALSNYRLIIGFCIGAEFGPAKIWPHYHYAALAEQLIAEGYQLILLGSIKDHKIGNAIIQMLLESSRKHCKNLVGQTQLEEAVILLAHCVAVVSNDSGLMHITAALNRPLVALYGPSNPDFTPPLSHKARVIRLIGGYYKVRYSDRKYGYHQSLIDINPSRVHQELITLLNLD